MLQVYHGVLFCLVLALFDIFNGLRRVNPALRVDVKDGGLRTLGILLGEEPQVLFADQDFSPYALGNIGGKEPPQQFYAKGHSRGCRSSIESSPEMVQEPRTGQFLNTL